MYISTKLDTEETEMMGTILRKESGKFRNKKNDVLRAALRCYYESREKEKWRK